MMAKKAAATTWGDERQFCGDCRRTTTVVLDHASGDSICTACGLVLGERFVDETSEWRTFAGDGISAEDLDPNRVGGGGDPFLAYAQLGTIISPAKHADGAVFVPKVRDCVGASASDEVLVDTFRAIADMADRLGLVATIRDRAKELFKKAEEAKLKLCRRSRDQEAVYAACLHIACRSEGNPRTLKELATATRGGVEPKDIGKAAKRIKRHLGEEAGEQGEGEGAGVAVARAADYMARFGSLLGMGKPEVRAAQAAARKAEEGLDVRRNPESIAAAIIYMAMQRAGAGTSAREVSMATGVAEVTIKEACKELSPHADLLFAPIS